MSVNIVGAILWYVHSSTLALSEIDHNVALGNVDKLSWDQYEYRIVL